MPFEVFTPTRIGRNSSPAVRVNREQNRMFLTKAAIELLPKACTHVVLAFEKDERLIALLATAPNDPKGVRISATRTISMGGFAQQFQIADGSYRVGSRQVNDRGALVSVRVDEHTEPEGAAA